MSNISKCLNAFNNYYYNEISKMANDARYKSNRNIVLIYKKVAASVSKYPFPILTSTQASTLEGVGETICKIFENLINCYKEKIKKENIDYISLAYQIDLNAKLKAQTKKSKKRKNDNDKYLLLSTKQKLKMKKNLVDIKLYSSIWTTVISSYILYIQNDQYEIGIDDVIAMSFTLSEQLKIININITQTNTNDFSEMKNLNIIDSFDTKKINVNSFLIRLACLELRKIGIKIIKDENNEINFDMYEQEKEIQPLNFDINDQKEEQELLEKYKSFMDAQNNNTLSKNVVMLVDMRERGTNNEDFKMEIMNLSEDNISIEERQLSLGDFLWIYKDEESKVEYVIDFIIERKTLNDLASSIVDGRYTEQKFRLKNSNFTNIYYLFEGTSLSLSANISKSAVNTAIYNTLNVHDINIVKTNSTSDTIDLLMEIDKNIKKNFTFLVDKNGEKITYDTFIKMNAKTRNANVESIFLRQLRTFDNCGSKSIEIINKCFKSPLCLYSVIKKCKDRGISQESLGNLINIASYLYNEGKEANAENIVYYLSKKENLSKIKKGIKSVKKLRKDTVEQIIKFYGGFDDIEEEDNENEDKKECNKEDDNISKKDENISKKMDIILEEKEDD